MFECYLWSNQPCRFCQTPQGFHRHGTLGAKNREVPGKLEQIGHPQNYFSSWGYIVCRSIWAFG